MSLPYNKSNVKLARAMRKNPTPQENRLWYDFLSQYPVRFQRQKPIDNYIADFYCHKAKLVIEVDGIQHSSEENIIKDEYRTEILSKYSLKVIRVTNRQIDRNFHQICDYIDQVIKENLLG
ncbi:MAG: endonuclease domain-containing protein [Clostridia bacterium]|nr:endonuclease domain-containing protein [Clostridia bacterium]